MVDLNQLLSRLQSEVTAEGDAGGGDAASSGGNGGGARRPAPDPGQVAALEEQAAKFEGQKRWADMVKTLVQKADILADDVERIATYERIAKVHTERTNNVAEAIKAFEAILEIDPDHASAIDFLKSRYEQRRDWEKLLGILRREARRAPEGSQLDAYLAMAKLAAEKIKKPEICIELWEQVLERDPGNMEALTQLSGFYERAKDFSKLAFVLREQAAQTGESAARIALLVKLGTIAGDKLNDDNVAVEAWRGVLALDANDRRAQEALKKRYLAMQAWDELEVFYADTGKWDELIRVLEREAENPGATNETKTRLFFKIAQLWAERKEKTDRAAKYYEKILELDAHNRDAALALIPIYGAANDAKKLAGVYEVKLLGDATADEKVGTLRALGELYEGKLKEPAKAFERFRDALAAAPEDARSIEDLERVSAATTRWSESVDALAAAITTDLAPEAQIRLRIHLGHWLATHLEKVDDAIARYREVMDLDPANVEALTSLDNLFRQTGRSGDLLEILEKRLALAETAEDRRNNLYAIGALSEGSLNDPNRAVQTYKEILGEFGDEPTALQRLDGLYNKIENWSELAEILERELVVFADNEAASLDAKFRLGRVLEQHLERAPEAIEHYREILAMSPEHENARGALEALLRNPELRGEAAKILEPIYEMRSDWEALIRSLEILLADETNVDAKITLLRKIGDVCSTQIGDGSRAFEAYGRAFQEDPTRAEVRDALEALAEPINAWPRFVTLLREIADAATTPELARASWMKIAEIEDQRLANVDAAVEAYTKVLAQDPADGEALASLEQLYQRTERWSDLLGVFRKRLDLTADPAQREELLAAIATVHDEKLTDPDSAIRTYREMLEADPVSPRALEALDHLFARLSRWNDLADNLQVRLESSSDPEEQTALMLRLAQLREDKMAQVEAAVEIYRQVLERDASNEAALGALERLVQQPAHAVMVAQILEPVYREGGAYEKLVGVHEIQVQYAPEAARKVELLHQVAELHETALDNPGMAFQTLARALTEDPGHEETVAGLERLARVQNAFQDLAVVYEARIESAPTPELKLALHQRAATVHEEALQNAPGAIEHYRQMLEIDARNLDAVSALERLYQLSEQYENLAAVYLKKAELLENPDESKAYLFRASEIYEQVLERPQDAVGVFRKVLEIDAEDINAIDALIRLFISQSRWEELLAIYEKKIDLVSDPDEKKRLHMEVGTVYEGELKDTPKAIDAYNKVLELDPDDLVAIQRLDHLYLTQGNWQELLTILEREADLAGDPNEVCAYRFRIGELQEKHLNDTAKAVEIYREILDVVSDHQPSLAALDAILHGEKEPIAAAAVLEPVYTAAGAYDRLVDVLEVQLRHASDNVARVELLHRIAEIYETALDNPRAAFDAYSRAMPFDPLNDQTLGNMEKLADVAGAWPDLVRVYDTEIEKLTENAEQQVELALRTAQIYEVQVGNIDLAIERYRKALSADPVNGNAIRSLGRLYEAREQWAELAEVLRKEVDLPDVSPDDVIQLRFRLAQVLEGALNDVEGAIGVYKDIVDSNPDHTPSIQSLEHVFARGIKQIEVAAILKPIYEAQGEWLKLAQLQEATLQFVTDPAERLAFMYGQADLFEEKLADAVSALQWYARALKESPLDERSLTEAERLAGGTQAWADLAGTYADIVEAATEDHIKQIIGKKLARIYEEELQDIENAEAAYNYVLSVVPLDAEALERLDVIYTGLGNAERLAQVLDRRVQASDDPQQKVDLSFRLGQLLESELQQVESAIARYRTIVDGLDAKHEDSLNSLERL
jgi:tetratricopeptide (TPR) repeat protein